MKKGFILAMSFFAVIGALAQNTVFTYQGRVTDNGTNFTGVGQFEFALVYVTNLNSQATAVADSIDFNGGGINGIQVLNGGNGYVTAPVVTLTSIGMGSGAMAAAVLGGGSVSSVNITAEGSGYNFAYFPIVSIAPPPPDLTNITLWSNDGTPSGEPATYVSVGVTNGLFAVVLGDTTLANMTGIPASLFATSTPLELAIWFNDGVHGFSALTPLQNVTPAPLAVYAPTAGSANSANTANTANTVLGQVPTSQLTGTFSGNGSGLTSLNAANLTGVVPSGSLTAVPAASLTGTVAQAELGTSTAYAPTIGDGTHNFSLTTQSGFYTVVGNLAHVEIWLIWNSKGSAVSTDGVQISLPLAVVSSRAQFTLGYFNGITYTTQLVAGANNNATSLFLDSASNTGGSPTGLTVANCGTGGEIQISGTYRWK